MTSGKSLSSAPVLFAAALLVILIEPAAAHHVMGGRMRGSFGDGFLSGLGHPVLGLDHLAAIIAVGCIAASQPRGAMLVIGFVVAMIAGAVVHVGQADIPGSEVLVALSVIALGLVMLLRPVPLSAALVLFALAGFFHGYALGESIAGAEQTPLYAYLAGLAVIQSGIALTVMAVVRGSAALPALEPARLRLIGAGIVGIGLAVLAQQIVPGA
jgi:urease accessory protein